MIDKANNKTTLEFKKNKKEIIKEMFEIKSKDGTITAGKTSKLDSIYTNLLLLSHEIIL